MESHIVIASSPIQYKAIIMEVIVSVFIYIHPLPSKRYHA